MTPILAEDSKQDLKSNDKAIIMQSPQTRQSQKNIDRWWLKYETIAHEDAIVSHEEFIEFAGAAYEAWLQSGKTAAQIEADIEHHIAMQKTFKKWREVHGDKI